MKKMKTRYLPYEKYYNEEAKSWGITGQDKEGNEFGIGLGETLAIARERLHDWVLFRMDLAADQGIDGEKLWLSKKESLDCLMFEGSDFRAQRRLRALSGKERRVSGERRGEESRRIGDESSEGEE
jgi:hypothetical protein